MLEFLQALAKLEKPQDNLREKLLGAIKEAAAASGMKASDYPGGYRVEGKESALVIVQFGGRREFYEMMETLGKEQVGYRVVIRSSKVKSMRIGEMKWILNNKYQTKDRWLILDIERAESPKTVNFMLYGGQKGPGGREGNGGAEAGKAPEAGSVGVEGYGDYEKEKEKPRRKRIYGVRGEHKEQD